MGYSHPSSNGNHHGTTNGGAKSNGRTLADQLKDKTFAITRRIVPSVRKQYFLDSLVGPIGHWDELQQFQFGFLVKMGLTPGHRLLDFGCGPLQGGLVLIRYLEAQNYVGLDVRPEVLKVAYQQIADHGLTHKNPRLIHSESFGRHELNGATFDYIWASQVLYHLSEAQVDQLLAQIAHFSHAQSRFFGDILGHHERVTDSSQWNGFQFHRHTLESLTAQAARHGLMVEAIGSLESHGYPGTISMRTNQMLKIYKNPRIP